MRSRLRAETEAEAETDMAKLLLEQQKEPFNMVWISYYWQQVCAEEESFDLPLTKRGHYPFLAS